MRIGIDALYLQEKNYQAGLYQYTHHLISGLQALDPANEYILYFLNWRSRKSDCILRGEPFSKNVRREICRIPYRALFALDRFGVPVSLFLGRVDLFHGPSFRLPPGRFFKKSVVTIHDLKFKHPELFADSVGREFFRRGTLDAIDRADLLVAVSDFTRAELIDEFDVSPERIRVVHPGIGQEFRPDLAPEEVARVKSKYGLKGCYVLFVGFLEAKKNLPRLIRAFAEVRKRLAVSYSLVLAGPAGPAAGEVAETIRECSLAGAVILTGQVPREDLPYLYGGADLFVFPSLHEGFGIPPLEAMACGVPVVSSRAASLPEVIGDAGLLVDPFKTEEIADAMDSVLTDQALCSDLKKRGLVRAESFSWGRMSKEILAIYKELGR